MKQNWRFIPGVSGGRLAVPLLEWLLKQPLWAGSACFEYGDYIRVEHASGAKARIFKNAVRVRGGGFERVW